MADVFISFARDDQAIARRVVKGLQAAGLDVWWDDNLPAHRSYSEEIERNLTTAKAVVVLWSVTAAKSQWVRAEADFARNAGKLVQGQVDGTLPPMPFNQIQCADLKSWRGNPKHRGWVKLKDSVDSVQRGERLAATPSAIPKQPIIRRLAAALGIVTLLALAALFLIPRLTADRSEQPRIAVLPFAAVAASDQALVEGIWEDTRQALSRNPQLLVLGPNSSRELAKTGSKAARSAADYLLDGSVRTAGKQLRFTTALVRTKDGAQIWSATFNRSLDDVFALQAQLATEIEGQIRGRLATKGGVLPEHISTSAEVYALYSEARRKLRQRGPGIIEAYGLLQRVVKMDPNFAPGWASLSVAEKLGGAITGMDTLGLVGDAAGYARKAIALAPNLAAGHAALGFAHDNSGPVAEAALRKAIELDPSDVETINWLAILLNQSGRDKESFELRSRAVEIEPLWWVTAINRLNNLLERGDEAGVAAELKRLDALDAKFIAAMARMRIAQWRGDVSQVLQIGLDYMKNAPPDERQILGFSSLTVPLVQLGYLEEAHAISGLPQFALLNWKNDPRGIKMIEALGLSPRRIWQGGALPVVLPRAYLNHGQAEKVVGLYRAVSRSPEEFAAFAGPDLIEVGPVVAVALKRSGATQEANRLVSLAEQRMSGTATRGKPYLQVLVARIYAAQGRKRHAIELLSQAVKTGWLPEIPQYMPDIALDPPLAELRTEPEFEKIRTQILNHLQKERAELGHVRLDELRAAAPSA